MVDIAAIRGLALKAALPLDTRQSGDGPVAARQNRTGLRALSDFVRSCCIDKAGMPALSRGRVNRSSRHD